MEGRKCHWKKLKFKKRVCTRCGNTFLSSANRGKICPECQLPKGTSYSQKDKKNMEKKMKMKIK